MSNRLIPILPDSLAAPVMAAAAEAAGRAEQRAFDLIPLAGIWSRLDELTDSQLDHLAWHLHIDGYSYAGSKAEKLWLVRHFHAWHRFKGTVHGHALYWRRLLDRSLLGHAPRYNSYCGASLTQAERRAFEDLHPEIRIYPFRNKGLVQGKFLNCILCPDYMVKSDAADRVGRQVYNFDPVTGQEVKLNRLPEELDVTVESPVEIAQAGRAAGLFLGSVITPSRTVDHHGTGRIFLLHPTAPTASSSGSDSLAAQALLPMYSNYSVAPQRGAAKGVFLSNRYPDYFAEEGGSKLGGYLPASKTWHKSCLVKSNAGDRIYKKLKLYDARRAFDGTRNARAFLGGFRLGKMPPHHGEISIDARGLAFSFAPWPGKGFAGHTYFTVSDASDRIKQVVDVGRLAARASDKVLLSISNYKRAKASSAYKAGAIKAGTYVLRVN
ncbi:MAG: phage tail protein [bacterium]|nr:phage tail protein [bacterium]